MDNVEMASRLNTYTMTRKEQTAVAQVLAICAENGFKLSRIARLGKAVTSGESEAKTIQLRKALNFYNDSFGKQRLSQVTIDKVVEAKFAGESAVQIARQTGLGLNSVYDILQAKYAGAPESGHKFPPTEEKRGRPKGTTKRTVK
jgi:hypothetical protein